MTSGTCLSMVPQLQSRSAITYIPAHVTFGEKDSGMRLLKAISCGLHRCALVALTTSALLLAPEFAAAQQRQEPPPSRAAAQYSFAPIVKTAAPAVVNVYVRARVQTFVSPFADDPLFRRFFGDTFGMPAERMQ